MFIIQKEIEFDAGHRVPLHESKCKNPHGHRYKVEVGILGDLITEGPETGMVRDFGDVKEILTKFVHDVYDHGFILWEGDEEIIQLFHRMQWKTVVVPFYPTAECLARSIYEDLNDELEGLMFVRVWETPTSMAEYAPDEGVYIE